MDSLFRELNDDEVGGFEKWADDNADKASMDTIGLYHPEVIHRWVVKGLLPGSKTYKEMMEDYQRRMVK